ncbi:MAG TPA: type II toxin-antitoxin system VapC family toxin [Burkholderiales bacterium]|jgi:predicted nucleic acid-binding protein|nr:type II toxin-antitoxin system VapC family toxin [Burkholderiales bacterium]
MAFVVDASATLPWFLEDERTAFTDSLLGVIDRVEYWAPAVWCLEICNVLLIAERRRRIDHQRRLEALDQASRLRIQIDASVPDMKAISALAARRSLSTYDAAYLELAMRFDFGLITLDRELAEAALAEGVALEAPGRSGAAQKRRRYNI